ncbi:putative protease of the subtilase family [Imhoffiella purpurea]|uniref:Putative protease of the subtilase family n=1 Tax=Imhoffiella purpurea TaxID=1249627 RepID=W9V7Q8_9GAMM|nr:putative protease of the subtilase family [Imhoffiella purpurea]
MTSGYVASSEADRSSPAVLPTLPLETGELEIDSDWQWVQIQGFFVDPVVVVKGLGGYESDPAVVRIKDVSPDGFSVRVQEWDYLDDVHGVESVTYLVMERGRHQLPSGEWIEAGSVDTKATNAFQYHAFSSVFSDTPVVFASVVTVNEYDTVNARLRNIDTRGFFVGMREQESSQQTHVTERIDYIAWEPSEGVVDGLKYAVGRTESAVTHMGYTLPFSAAFERAPLFIADMQTTAGSDAASLRWTGLEPEGVDIWVQEEQSRDAEMRHNNAESIGYFVAEAQY